MGEIARSKSRIASDLKTRDSNRWRPCDSKLRFETRDWRFVLNIPIQQNCKKGCDLSPRSKIASDWRLAILHKSRKRFGPSRFLKLALTQEWKGHINLRKLPGTLAGCLWDTRRNKQRSAGRCPRDLLVCTKKNRQKWLPSVPKLLHCSTIFFGGQLILGAVT